MNWGERTMKDKLDVKSKEVGRLIKWYFDDEIWVNTKYQRKLVWSLPDKKLFIDSILNNFPTPSMMLASYDIGNVHRYEIIDGLQRINAIISFVTNEFPVVYKGKKQFFDLNAYPLLARQVQSGNLVQKEPVLPDGLCDSFITYELPLILTEQAPEKIEQIFCRINSSGKKLSAHDLRQSGSCDEFSNLVRRVSSMIRGDMVFYDLINLADIPRISIKSRGLNYGISFEDSFWSRHDIITFENLRKSSDEKLVAQILGEILNTGIINPSSQILDKMYAQDDKLNKFLNKAVKEIGMENIEDKMKQVFDTIEMVFHAVNSDFSSWMFKDRKSKHKNDCFRIFFICIYKMFQHGFKIDDYKQFATGIELLADNLMGAVIKTDSLNQKMWNDVKNAVLGAVEALASKEIKPGPSAEEKEISHSLSLSSVESQMTEYKAGISNFDTGEISKKTIRRIAIALTAMSNTNSEEEGYILLGIADNKEAARNWEAAFNEKPLIYGGHHILGISQEAVKYFHGVDKYYNKIGELLAKEPIDNSLKEFVLANYVQVNFKGKLLVKIPIKKSDGYAAYDGKVYKRQGNCSVLC